MRTGRLVATWTLVALAAGVLVAAVLVPRVAGATPYTVLTGSMQPTYPPGTLVVVRPTSVEDVAVGDVVTYQRDPGRPDVVTHRVVAVARDTVTGRPLLTTRGDANAADDADPVRGVQLRGTLWYAVPLLGRLQVLLAPQQRRWATYAVGGALLAYALVTGAGALRSPRARPRPAPRPPGGRHRMVP